MVHMYVCICFVNGAKCVPDNITCIIKMSVFFYFIKIISIKNKPKHILLIKSVKSNKKLAFNYEIHFPLMINSEWEPVMTFINNSLPVLPFFQLCDGFDVVTFIICCSLVTNIFYVFSRYCQMTNSNCKWDRF